MSHSDPRPHGAPPQSGSTDVRFVDLGEARTLLEGGYRTTLLEGREVVVIRAGGRFHAISNRCPHNGMPLQDGCIENNVITCRWHGWQFDLTTGRTPGSEPEVDGPRIRVYHTRVEDGRLQVGAASAGRPAVQLPDSEEDPR